MSLGESIADSHFQIGGDGLFKGFEHDGNNSNSHQANEQ